MKNFTPKEIVYELDRYIIGQKDAKKAVAVALRNRWRRIQLDKEQQKEIMPKNILMIGPTGVGKTEIARRLSQLDDSPFIKVEATKFTEVGYVGRDVEQIIRDLLEIAIHNTSKKWKEEIKEKVSNIVDNKILDILVGVSADKETRKKFQEKLNKKELDDKEIEITIKEKSPSPFFDIPGVQGAQISMIPLGNMLGTEKNITKKTTVQLAKEILSEEESEILLDKDTIIKSSIETVENNGLVFIDEVDKIAASGQEARGSGTISREGVQRDLLPLVEGTIVQTKHGSINTEHILFIASGAFHLSSPSDLLPELQGRFPIRVELNHLSKDDLIQILTTTKNNLISQYVSLLSTENIKLVFEEASIEEMAENAVYLNQHVENIGARRLQTILEKVLEDISFNAPDIKNKKFIVTKDLVVEKLSKITKNNDLSKFIL